MTYDLIKTTTTSTGTGNITVSSTAHIALRCCPLGDIPVNTAKVPIRIEDEAGTDWELSYCTILSATTFSRDTVIRGSNGTSKVNFGAGPKSVYATLTAAEFNKLAGADNSVATTVASVNTTTVPIIEANVPKQITLANLLAAIGTSAPNLPAATTLADTDIMTVTQDGVTEARVTLAVLKTYFGTPTSGGTVTAASGVTMSGPTTGQVSVASTNFSVGVTPVGGTISGTVTVTPSDNGGGGTFNPTSVTLTTAAPSTTFKYTPSATAGARTISVTNNGSLANPANITYTSTAAAANVPGAPTIGTAVAGNGYIDVAFTAPASDGGSAILDYTATLSTGQTATGTTSPIRVTAPNGIAATATVKARNAVGPSAASAASNSVTPAAPASTVTGVTVNPATITLAGAGTQTFTATVAGTNSPSQAVTWTTTAGSITSGGAFTAPASTGSAQTVTITATSTQDGTKLGTATVTVSAAAPAVYTITPYTAGNTFKTTIDRSTATGTFTPQKWFDPGLMMTTTATYWNFSPVVASGANVRCGWGTSSTTAPSEITAGQNVAADLSVNGLAPMTKAADPSWVNDTKLWVPAGAGSGPYYFWIRVGTEDHCMNPAGLMVT